MERRGGWIKGGVPIRGSSRLSSLPESAPYSLWSLPSSPILVPSSLVAPNRRFGSAFGALSAVGVGGVGAAGGRLTCFAGGRLADFTGGTLGVAAVDGRPSFGGAALFAVGAGAACAFAPAAAL